MRSAESPKTVSVFSEFGLRLYIAPECSLPSRPIYKAGRLRPHSKKKSPHPLLRTRAKEKGRKTSKTPSLEKRV